MRINFSKHIIVFIGFLTIWNSALAQLHDVYSGKSIELEHRVINFAPTISFVKNELDFDCLYITNKPSSKIDLVNKNVLDLYKSYLLSEEKFRPVYQKVLKQVEQFQKYENSRNTDEYRDNSSDKSKIELTEVNCHELSYVSDLLFFSVNFNFRMDMGYNDDLEFLVSEYYYVNITNGEITKLDFEWDASQKEMIIATIKDILNSDYYFALTSYKFDNLNDFQSVRKIETNDSLFSNDYFISSDKLKKDISSGINLDEADIYWYGWGLIFNFPAFSESSSVYNGNSFEVFVPGDRALKIVKDLKEFSFVKKLESTPTELKDFSLKAFSEDAIDIYDPREITDFVKQNNFNESAKSVEIIYYQMMRDSSKHNLSTWKHEFNRNGDLLKTIHKNEKGELYSSSEYLYSKKGKLLVKANFNDKEAYEDSEIYWYDKNGNLIQTIYNNDGNGFSIRYFYNGNHVYQMIRYFIKDSYSERISKNYYDGKVLQLDDQTFFLNEAGKITGNMSNKYTMYQLQISRNERNQLVEVHRENDRYNRYFQYDSNGRLELITNFEGSRIGKSEQFYYDGIFPFPKMYETFDPTGGHNTHLFFEYTWELY